MGATSSATFPNILSSGTEFIIKIDFVYFLGIIGVLLGIAWYASHRFTALETSIDWIKREFEKIWDSIKTLEATRAGVEGRESPLNPTKLGWTYLKESGLEKIIDVEKKEWLLENLRNSLPQNYVDYDVQEVARRVMVSLRDDSMMREVKEYAFKKGLDVDLILRLGGLLLRDNFLEQEHIIAPSSLKNK